MCTCEPAVHSLNRACPSCQAEYISWSQALEEAGIIGPHEPQEQKHTQRKAAHRAALASEAAANIAFYNRREIA
jgi:hypothetical protein